MTEAPISEDEKNKAIGVGVFLLICAGVAAYWYWPSSTSKPQSVLNDLGGCYHYGRAWRDEASVSDPRESAERKYVIDRFQGFGDRLADTVEAVSRRYVLKIENHHASEIGRTTFVDHLRKLRSGGNAHGDIEAYLNACAGRVNDAKRLAS